MKYFSDFSYESYKNLLSTGKNCGYSFQTFTPQNINKANSIFIRHDIDIDLKDALNMAVLEHKMGIKTTYFLMLRSPVYNLFSRENNEYVKQIISLGHQIGLHYDEGYYSDKSKDLNDLIEQEVQVMKTMLGVEIPIISFHQPSKRVLNNEVKLTKWLNTYDQEDMKGIYYMSDSNMQFKENPVEAIKSKKHDRIQILIHPVWWHKNSISTEEIWARAITRAFDQMQTQILETERAYGDKKVFKIGDVSVHTSDAESG